MKNISVYFLFFYLVLNSAQAQDTIIVFYDEDWKEIKNEKEAIFHRKAFKDSNNVWVAYDYYNSNNIQMVGSFKSKKCRVKQGHFVYYHENGEKSSEGTYINDKNEGIWSYWYENKQKRSVGRFLNGKNNGNWNYYYENGHKKSEGNFVNNLHIGEWIYYDEDGIKKTTGSFLANERDGEWLYYYKSGKLKDKEFYSKGLINKAEGYFDNGTKSYSGNFEQGKPNGNWTYWNSEGRITLSGDLKNGMKDGAWIRYFSKSEMKLYYNKGVLEGKQLGGIVKNK